jgi:hypothetical protein
MSAPAPFRARFDALVAALRAHPQVEIYQAIVNPPASEEAIRAAEATIGCAIPADLREFYRGQDGVFLEWGLRGRDYRRTAPFEHPDYGQPPGCINLLSVAAAISPAWQADFHVNEIDGEHQKLLFGAALDPAPTVGAVCVDNFSKYNHGDLVLGPDPVMVVSTDHGADMDSSDWCSFSTYLELTFAIHGLNRYSYGLGIGWSRAPRRVDAWSDRPTLDELLMRVAANED